ncbi:LAETG motif-containing sortase-dependent surface protein [Streptomyces fuscigenes]|uniref:LAETG motif-containing sortase-dependent surface protein n=1 Tax=Streptomyces fuscigenes TaxID=1528880 RepID=UPI0027E12921|nr:LAETG motif-containing sortase-dependent surface protein [Streptomyces fuscigenes]
MALAVSLAGVGTASAHGKGGGQGHCSAVQLKFSTDGGNSWTRNDVINTAPSSIQVKLEGKVTKGCAYPVSLAAYKTDGPTWDTSGTQVFLGVDQATLSKDNDHATLQVKGIDKSTCFGQIDMYGNNTVYDGKSGALPHFPDSYTPTDLIAHWNGAFEDCDKGGGETTPPAGGGETTPPAGGGETTPPAGGGETTPPAGGGETTPPAGGGETTPPAGGDTTPPATPSSSPSSSAPAVADTAAPSGTPVAQPVSSTPTLAETGSNSSQTTTFVAAGAALVVIGAGAVVFTRRRNRTQA